MIKSSIFLLFGALLCVSIGCAQKQHFKNLHSAEGRKMTAGIVQREIYQGMDQGAVAQALGSPNIVSKDKEGRETWIYDKISSEVSYSTGSRGIAALIIGGQSSGAAASTQKTLTVVIKFNDQQIVDSFSYHSSSF